MTRLPAGACRLGQIALALGVMLPFASLPPLALGYWDKAEPLVVGLHAIAALAALALALAAWRAPALVWAGLRHPVVLLPLALGVWSMAVAPWVALPRLSLTGAPQSGFGAVWQIDLGLLIATARLARLDAAAWRRLGDLAVAAVAAVAALKGFDWISERSGGSHLLVWVASYYGWLGPAMAVMALEPGDSRGRRALVLAVAAAVVLVGRSVSIGAASLLGLAVAGVIGRLDQRRIGAAGAGLAAAAALIPGLLVVFVPVLRDWPSVADRRSLLTMVWAEVSGWPASTWITGLGWGRTQDVFQAQLAVSGMRLWDGSWIFMSSDYFNSHNFLSEALLGAGIPGLALSLSWPLALVLACDPARRRVAAGFAVALAGFSAIWFPLALGLPLTAMAVASLAPRPEPSVAPPRPALTGAAAVLAAALLGLAVLLVQHGRDIIALQTALTSGSKAIPAFPADPRGGDLAAAEMIRDEFNRLETVPSADRGRWRPAAQAMANYLRRRIPETQTVLLPVTGLSLMTQMRMSEHLAWLEGDLGLSGPVWAEWLDRTWHLAPGRSDLAIPLFTRLAVMGRADLLEGGVQRVLRRDPHDPVGLYFWGLLLVQRPEPEAKRAGLAQVRASIDAGLERFMPVDPALLPLLRP